MRERAGVGGDGQPGGRGRGGRAGGGASAGRPSVGGRLRAGRREGAPGAGGAGRGRGARRQGHDRAPSHGCGTSLTGPGTGRHRRRAHGGAPGRRARRGTATGAGALRAPGPPAVAPPRRAGPSRRAGCRKPGPGARSRGARGRPAPVVAPRAGRVRGEQHVLALPPAGGPATADGSAAAPRGRSRPARYRPGPPRRAACAAGGGRRGRDDGSGRPPPDPCAGQRAHGEGLLADRRGLGRERVSAAAAADASAPRSPQASATGLRTLPAVHHHPLPGRRRRFGRRRRAAPVGDQPAPAGSDRARGAERSPSAGSGARPRLGRKFRRRAAEHGAGGVRGVTTTDRGPRPGPGQK